jgi:DNA-directed RNA polymerase subunit omega
MARLTSEIAAQKVGSKYDLILIAARRARELNRGWKPLLPSQNGITVTALREIEAGLIGREYLAKPQNLGRKEKPPESQD